MSATFTFDAATHAYAIGSRIIPSVTQVLEEAGLCDLSGIPEAVLERKRLIGSEVHQACQFIDEGADVEVDEAVQPYVYAYEAFLTDTGFKPTLIEHQMVANVRGMHYGMTLDRVGTIGQQEWLLDLKTSYDRQDHWPIQTAAYSVGIAHEGKRGVLWLRKSGKYELIEHTDADDAELFLAALRVVLWRRSH